jgi:Domain of unknown function (DUF1841)
MNDSAIRDLTLGTWAASVWEKELRGVPLAVQEASLAYCMREHTEWREHWNRLNTIGQDDPKIINILAHIYNDAAVKLQIERKNPPEIGELYQALRRRGITDMDAIHAIAFVLQEQTLQAKNTGVSFDMKDYVQRVKSNVRAILENPKLIRISRARCLQPKLR